MNNLRDSLSSAMKRGLLSIVDRGWFGTNPLETHVVICGFPRAGSTLLQLMITACVENVRTFPKERNALSTAMGALRNHRFMLSKRPNDIFRVEEIRDYYATKPANVRFLLTMRDPRDVFLSQHATIPGESYVDATRWRDIYERFQLLADDVDVHVVRFEELVTNHEKVQDDLAAFIHWKYVLPFGKFAERQFAQQKLTALNGLRPPDASAVSKWRDPRHREKLQQCVAALPTLPQLLVDLGYEKDDRWLNVANT